MKRRRTRKNQEVYYIISKTSTCKGGWSDGDEYIQAIGYTNNPFIVQSFMETISVDDVTGYICEEVEEDDLVGMLDLYDLTTGNHELYMQIAENDPTRYAVISDAIKTDIDEQFSVSQTISNMINVYFTLLALSKVFKNRDDIIRMTDVLKKYIILFSIGESYELDESMLNLIKQMGCSDNMIRKIEIDGIYALQDLTSVYTKYIATQL